MSFIGPALPPHLVRNDDSESPDPTRSSDSSEVESQGVTNDKGDDSNVYGPALPPGLQKVSSIGPALPPGLRERLSKNESDEDVSGNRGSESEDEDLVGPMPMPSEGESSYAARLIEERSQRMHQKLKGKGGGDGPKKREEWMLELPEGRTRQAMLGMNLAPRTFQTRPAPKLNSAGRSAWTDTPADKERKAAAKKDGGGEDDERANNDSGSDEDEDNDFLERKALIQRDKVMEKITEEHNSLKRKESLLDMHLKRQKKEAKKKKKKEKKKRKESGKSERVERRPFDRDVDLQANRFDEAQKAAILKKAQLLDDRFSQGRQKFL